MALTFNDQKEVRFMIDIEATGVDQEKDVILEIGILETRFDGRFWQPGREFHKILHYAGEPESEFAKTHMVELYKRCNDAPHTTIASTREEMLAFFKECGHTGHGVVFMGWNSMNFDVPFLNKVGYLKAPGYETVNGEDIRVGDHHYRQYEMSGVIQFVQDVLGRDRDTVLKEAEETDHTITLPEGKEHDALYDCYKQLKLVNGLISLTRIDA